MNLIHKISKNIFYLTVILYSILMCFYIYGKTQPRGDEFVFFYDIDLINSVGWIKSIETNISIPYMLISYPFTLIFNKLLGLKLANLALFLIMLIYIKKRNNAFLSFYFYLLFYLFTTIFFFLGINDSIFSFGLFLFFNETYLLIKYKKFNSAIALTGLIIAVFTRSLYLVYLPIIIWSFYLIYKNRTHFKFNFKIPAIVFVCFMVLNIPSLIKNHSISYDLKNPPEAFTVSWSQRQYLAQLLVNSGKLEVGNHPTWEETQAYVDKNGFDALPYSVLDAMFFDIKLTVLEFFKDFTSSIFYSFRQVGLIIFFPFIVLVIGIYKKTIHIKSLYVPILTLVMLGIFSFIIISNVELRWLMPLYILLIIWFSDLEKEKKLAQPYFISNYLIMTLLLCYGGFKVYNKLF